ncbi:hypothetical protein [Salinibacillus xinjiangensis]|uniref:Uncharacterized protein n=1 Tax=Salinibacillus xinjiangensis TaxID=1229268 RepID=A0A6G1X7M3_9BACI|nr:hypothetical protein [Salinibacillus xinjiangensis]MRG86905.1 hypothetical protein [Salinibacillus xinjiangensis]
MPDPFKEEKDSRVEYDNDVDRMINEGMAGGTVGKHYNRVQIEEARKLPKEGEDWPDAREARSEDERTE